MFQRIPRIAQTAVVALIVLLAVVLPSVSPVAAAAVTTPYGGTVGTKVNSGSATGVETQVNLTRDGAVLKQVQVVAPATKGALQLDTSNTGTWKAPVLIAPNTWTVTTKAANATYAGVYLNGQYRALTPGTKLTVKVIAGGSLYLKLNGMAPTGVGSTKAGIESETSSVLRSILVVQSVAPEANAVVSTTPAIDVTFNRPLGAIDLNGISIDCGEGPQVFQSWSVTNPGVLSLFGDPLPPGATCTVTIGASAVAADDGATLPADYSWSFSVDAAPEVTAAPNNPQFTSPGQVFFIGFSEPVTLDAGAITIECSGGTNFSSLASGSTTGVPVTVGIITGSCTLTVFADKVHDVDGIDAPDTMLANVTRTLLIVGCEPNLVSEPIVMAVCECENGRDCEP